MNYIIISVNFWDERERGVDNKKFFELRTKMSKSEVKEIFNEYNDKYSNEKFDGGFEDYLDSLNIEWTEWKEDLVLSN